MLRGHIYLLYSLISDLFHGYTYTVCSLVNPYWWCNGCTCSIMGGIFAIFNLLCSSPFVAFPFIMCLSSYLDAHNILFLCFVCCT